MLTIICIEHPTTTVASREYKVNLLEFRRHIEKTISTILILIHSFLPMLLAP